VGLLEPLRRALAATSEVFATGGFDPGSARRTFRAVVPDVIAVTLVPRLLRELRRWAPLCRLELLPWSLRSERRPDVDMVITSEVEQWPGFRLQPLFDGTDVLARARRPHRGVDVLAREHLAVVAAGMEEDPVDSWLRTQGVSRRIEVVVPHYLLAFQLVAQAGLTAILPSRASFAGFLRGLPSRAIASLGPALGISSYALPIELEPDLHSLLFPPPPGERSGVDLAEGTGIRALRRLTVAKPPAQSV